MKALHIAIFQETQILAEHHGIAALVAEQQGHPAGRLFLEDSLDVGDNRGDARARRDEQVIAGVGRGQPGVEAALGRHQLDGITGLQVLIGVIREQAALHPLDGHFQKALGGRRADRVGAFQLLSVHRRFQGEVLALGKPELLLQPGGDGETNPHRVLGLGGDALYAYLVKMRFSHGDSYIFLKKSKGSEQARHWYRALQAVEPNSLTSSTSVDWQCGQHSRVSPGGAMP